MRPGDFLRQPQNYQLRITGKAKRQKRGWAARNYDFQVRCLGAECQAPDGLERDYQELKQEVGLGHYEGRGWRGFHHHATLCIAAYGFLIAERATIPPHDLVPPRRSRHLAYPTVIDPEALPSRPERHIPNSIATMRVHFIRALE